MSSYIDSHVHAWSDQCKLVEGRRYTPNGAFTVTELMQQMESGGVHKAVLVQPSFLGTDNSYLLKQLRQCPDIYRGIAVVEEGIARHELQAMMSAGVKGIRLNIVGKQLSKEEYMTCYGSILELVRELRGHVEIHSTGNQWLNIIPIVEEIGLPLVVDHLGRTESPQSTGFQAIVKAMETGRVWVKLSGWYRLKSDVKPFAEVLLAAGRERLVWGSDCPWTQHEQNRTYSDCLANLETWVGEQNVETIVRDNPSSLYGF